MVWLLSRRERVRRRAAVWFARLRGEPSESDRQAFRRWYEADPLHALTFDRMNELHASAGVLARSEMGRSRALPQGGRPLFPTRLAVAGVALALVAILGTVLLLGSPPWLSSSAQAQTLRFATRVGEIRQVILPDKSQLTLDTDSAVEVRMDRSARRITLSRGRARLALSEGDPRPFILDAGLSEVRTKAGTIDVSLQHGEARVRLLTGDAEVQSTSRAAERQPARLSPGQAVLVSPTGELRVIAPENRSAALWPTGRLEFDNAPLAQVIAEANRYNPIRISVADSSIARLRVTGTFRAGDTEGLARSLAAAFGLRVERGSAGHLILRQGSEPKGSD